MVIFLSQIDLGYVVEPLGLNDEGLAQAAFKSRGHTFVCRPFLVRETCRVGIDWIDSSQFQ